MGYWRAKLIVTVGVVSGFAFLLSCGGGGGGNGGVTPAIPYSGINTAAFITSENAVNLATGAYYGRSLFESSGGVEPMLVESSNNLTSMNPPKNNIFLSRLVKQTATEHLNAFAPGKAVQLGNADPLGNVDDRMYGDCDGYADMRGSVGNNGDFDVNVTYRSYSDDCVFYMSGRTNEKGNIDPYSYKYTHITITYEALVFTIGGTSITQSGTWFTDYRLYPVKEIMDIVTRDDSTGKTYWMKDYESYWSTGWNGSSNYDELETTGQYYDPDYGYVDITTEQALRIRFDESHPYEGELIITGNGNTRARLEIISTAVCRITCDTDGDDEFDDYDSGLVHWPGENNPPIANAGLDMNGTVECLITLDGSGSTDQDLDDLNFHWTILSSPPASSAILSNSGERSPTLIPDREGTYIIELIVDDGFTLSSPDTVNITATTTGNFCIQKTKTGSHPEAVAIGDINGDGRNDVVVTTSSYSDPDNDHKLFVFHQNSSGQLSTPIKYPAGNGDSVDIGDLNGDGLNDVAVSFNGAVGVFAQSDSGTLSSIASYPSLLDITHLRIGDFNNDGRMDVTAIEWGSWSNRAEVFLQNANGTLDNYISFDVDHGGRDDLDVGDVNGDGLTDILVMSGQPLAHQLPHHFGILHQNSSGTFDAPQYYEIPGAQGSPVGIAVGDLSDDNKDDVLISFPSLNKEIAVFYQNASGTLDSAVFYPSPVSAGPVEIDDLTGDGKKDALVLQDSHSVISLFPQGSGGSLQSAETTTFYVTGMGYYNKHGLVTGDINSDGMKDIIVADIWRGQIVILYHK